LLLEKHGLQVFTAGDGLEGANLIERVQPDLALVDLGLPVMSGFELLARGRSGRR
jgi:chemosensory pili system protein ChpA (sensor histidine kinase/response regulator)